MSYRVLYPLRTYLVSSGVYPEHYNVMVADWVSVVSGDPFMVSVSISPKRYTYKLVKTYGEFVVAVPTIEYLDDIWVLGSESGPEKLRKTRLSLRRGVVVRAPVVEEALANIECRVVDSRLYGDHELFIAEVVYVHKRPGAYTDSEPSLENRFVLHVARDKFTTTENRVYRPGSHTRSTVSR